MSVAQQIILFKNGLQNTPQQCMLVEMAYQLIPGSCCVSWPRACVTVGSLEQIQLLIQMLGNVPTVQAPPTPRAEDVHAALSRNQAVIMHVQSSAYTSHVVIIRGMYWEPAISEYMLIVNDPLSYFTQPIPFSRIVRYWLRAIIVQL